VLAQRLRNSTRQERQSLYGSLYDELFRSVPHHSQLTRKSSPEETARKVAYEFRHVQAFLHEDTTFLEVGPGDCALSFEVAKRVKIVYAVDVSEEITKSLSTPPNFKLILSDGTGIPVPRNSVDIAYSNQLMEHLHPDDAQDQLHNVYDVLVPGGMYVCITPNRTSGPHDISKHFDTVATGFHLKEYSVTELDQLFKDAGFSKVRLFVPIKKIRLFLPLSPIKRLEKMLDTLSYSLRKRIVSIRPVGKSLGIHKVAIK